MNQSVLAGALAYMLLGQQAGLPGLAQEKTAPQTTSQAISQITSQTVAEQQAIPDAPKPQALPLGSIAPGKGTPQETPTPKDPDAPGTSLPSSPPTPAVHEDDGEAPELPVAGEGTKAFTLAVQVNFVQVPFTVKDKKGALVPGLTWRDVRIYENGLRQRMQLFTVDPFPLSVALVIDQSMPFDEMTKVNNALGPCKGPSVTTTRSRSSPTTTARSSRPTSQAGRARGSMPCWNGRRPWGASR